MVVENSFFRIEFVWLKGDGNLLIHHFHLSSLYCCSSWGSFVNSLCSLEYILETTKWPDPPGAGTCPHLEHQLPHLTYVPFQPLLVLVVFWMQNAITSFKASAYTVHRLWKVLLCPSSNVCLGKYDIFLAKMLKHPSFLRFSGLVAPCFVLPPSPVRTLLGCSNLNQLCFPSAQ